MATGDQERADERPARRGAGWALGGLLVAAAAVVIVIVVRSQQVTPFLPSAQRGCGTAKLLVLPGQQVPMTCKVQALDSSAVETLAAVSGGKPLVVNFWASWCEACYQEMPDLQRVSTAAGGSVHFLGLDLLGVQGEVASEAEAFAKARKVTYPLAYDDGALLYGRISPRFLPPTTAFVRPDGTLAGYHVGQLDTVELRQEVQQYLGVQVPA
ncbi:MAG TPA: TlpA disulfide reductase family protein [Actinomycetota bacterium]|nr:TlpA disulfide reductase family protein [Actinomycetota bacterium]